MNRTWHRNATAALLFAAALSVARAAEPTLSVGDPAPPLKTGRWIQGDPVKGFERGNAYLVEFWATWCGPCRVSIPHLNTLHTRFADKGLVVIGQDCWEHDESQVEPFVKSMGEQMTYRVALDDKTGNERGAMAETWMEAAGRQGIPSAFLVDTQGLVAWIGHPMQLKDSLIEAVLAGTFDLKKATSDYAIERKNETQLMQAWMDLNQAMQARQWDQALARLDEAAKLFPEGRRDQVEMMRFRVLLAKGDPAGACAIAGRLSEANPSEAMMQNELAWAIAIHDDVSLGDLETAEKIAVRANDAASGKDAGILDTLARIRFRLGNKTSAVELQEKAVELADESMKPGLRKVLDSYKAGELPKAD